ncbi:hypothetical protein GPECTOR_57g485 [Gonium pectorale]|uniref:Uncharacterized protein n=1 Tax=Gonium pectorale TaxID=33097 RepID=A0A150G6N6_GONPE|nr:hypothetical protein GPECTOR_57g485 [Gonium pectorale]|eukprot:KXZ45195.1 hypothetical protein GPECTOR_57g485 [Gonium pectorale]
MAGREPIGSCGLQPLSGEPVICIWRRGGGGVEAAEAGERRPWRRDEELRVWTAAREAEGCKALLRRTQRWCLGAALMRSCSVRRDRLAAAAAPGPSQQQPPAGPGSCRNLSSNNIDSTDAADAASEAAVGRLHILVMEIHQADWRQAEFGSPQPQPPVRGRTLARSLSPSGRGAGAAAGGGDVGRAVAQGRHAAGGPAPTGAAQQWISDYCCYGAWEWPDGGTLVPCGGGRGATGLQEEEKGEDAGVGVGVSVGRLARAGSSGRPQPLPQVPAPVQDWSAPPAPRLRCGPGPGYSPTSVPCCPPTPPQQALAAAAPTSPSASIASSWTPRDPALPGPLSLQRSPGDRSSAPAALSPNAAGTAAEGGARSAQAIGWSNVGGWPSELGSPRCALTCSAALSPPPSPPLRVGGAGPTARHYGRQASRSTSPAWVPPLGLRLASPPPSPRDGGAGGGGGSSSAGRLPIMSIAMLLVRRGPPPGSGSRPGVAVVSVSVAEAEPEPSGAAALVVRTGSVVGAPPGDGGDGRDAAGAPGCGGSLGA